MTANDMSTVEYPLMGDAGCRVGCPQPIPHECAGDSAHYTASLRPYIAEVQRALRRHASPEKAALLQRFFRTGPGEYGEGDRFIGVMVPAVRQVARAARELALPQVAALLESPIHEERLLALLVVVGQFERAGAPERQALYDFYLSHTARINNWDLVDVTAPKVVGEHLLGRSRAPLRRLARSANLWERRIAIVSTGAFIRRHQFEDTLRIAAMLLRDKHDLIHKAVGWMLREVGKRDMACLEGFLRRHCRAMPRTMLRYAIERFPEARRRAYLAGTPPSE